MHEILDNLAMDQLKLLDYEPSKRKVSTSSLISKFVSPRPSLSLAASRMSKKSRYFVLLEPVPDSCGKKRQKAQIAHWRETVKIHVKW